ncbi:MAG: transcription elongation factor GreA [Mycoplasmataceae bacterium]|jgi:transcription elongation factor GreA|nr:transcription elongation factor GreA [Mycoplasmataceae bacterium]
MANNKVLLTKEKLDDLQREFDELVNVKRPEIIKTIQTARNQGDLSENADYDSAKDQQGEIESRISEIEAILNNYEIIDINRTKKQIVAIGKTIEIYDESDKVTYAYEIVGEVEADPSMNKISNVSPFAKALMGKEVGERVQILNIEKPYYVEIKKIS